MASISQRQMDGLTTWLADNLCEVRTTFYEGCLGVIDALGDVGRRPFPELTKDGHFVVASFQMWLMFGLLDTKCEQYLPGSLAGAYGDQMYAKVIVPYLTGEPTRDEAARGVHRFTQLSEQDDGAPYEEFVKDRMKQIIFTGKCKYGIDGYWRSSLDLGLNLGIDTGMGMWTGISAMTRYLIEATQYVIASAFGDHKLAAAKKLALDELEAQ